MHEAAIVPCGTYEPAAVRTALLQALDAVGGLGWVTAGMKIAIKANLVSAMKPDTAAAVHPVVATELARLLVERGAQVTLGDSPGGLFTPAALSHVYHATGMTQAQEAGAILNTDTAQVQGSFPQARAAASFTYTGWLDSADAIIDLCKLKTHGLMTMTCAVKNLFGVIPGTMKPEYHFRFPDPEEFAHMLIDLNEYFRRDGRMRLCICDAIECMEGNGPTQGTPKHVGALLASPSPYALDLAAAPLLHLEPEQVLTILCARERGLCPASWRELDLFGDLEAFVPAQPFTPAGDTMGWFIQRETDPPIKKLLKKGFQRSLRSRPQPTRSCVGCGVCAGMCPAKAIHMENKKAQIDRNLCIRCFCCQEFCPSGAMVVKRTALARLLGH